MEEFFTEHMEALLKSARYILDSIGPCDAAIEPGDLVNNLFLWFLEDPARWDKVDNPLAYCRTAIRRNALMLLRKAKGKGHLSEAYVCPNGAPPGGWPERASDPTARVDERIMVEQMRDEFPYVGRALDNEWSFSDWNRAYVYRRRDALNEWANN